MRPKNNPWGDLLVFFLLINTSLVIVFLLLATRHYYAGFGQTGRLIAWIVVVSAFVGLASLLAVLIRLYVAPLLEPPVEGGNP